jgi:hypothetical protein
VLKTETEIAVPDVIILKSDVAERTIRLENCQNQNEIMEYLKICLSLFSVHYPERIVENSEATLKILGNACRINKETLI